MRHLLIIWLLIQAAIVASSLQMADGGSEIKWGDWSKCQIHEVCPHGRRERRRLCDEGDTICIKMVQIGKCRIRNCKREDFTDNINDDRIKDQKIKPGGTKAPEQAYSINKGSYNENNVIKYRVKSKDNGTTRLTHLVCAILSLCALYVSSSPEKHQGQSSTNEMVLPPPIIKTSVGPPPKEGLNITAPYSDPGCDKMFGSTPFSGTPTSKKGKDMNNCDNAGRNDDNPPQESPNFGGDVKKEIKSDLSANFTSPILTEPARNETRNNIHPQINDTLRDENFVEKTVDHKGATEPKFTVKSPESQSKNNLKIEHIDNSLKQTDSSKSTKRSRFSFFKRKNKSAECLETKPSKDTKKKKIRSFFSFFRKKKSNQKTKVRLDPSPCKDADQCVTKVASCPNLRSISSERLKWESRTRTASLNDLGPDVIKESSRFL